MLARSEIKSFKRKRDDSGRSFEIRLLIAEKKQLSSSLLRVEILHESGNRAENVRNRKFRRFHHLEALIVLLAGARQADTIDCSE